MKALREHVGDALDIFFVITAIALGIYALSFFPFMGRTWQTISWVLIDQHYHEAVPCEIISTNIRDYGSVAGTTPPQAFAAKIRFRYTYDGRTYTVTSGNRGANPRYPWYIAMDLQANKERIEKLLAAFPEGTKTTCYVDTRAPQFAVLRNKMPPLSLMLGLLPLALLPVGGYIGRMVADYLRLRMGRRRARAADDAARREKRRLNPAQLPVFRLGELTFRVLVLVPLFVTFAFFMLLDGMSELRDGNAADALFDTGFAAGFVALLVFLGIRPLLRQLRESRSTPLVTLCPWAPRAGESIELTWQIPGLSLSKARLDITASHRQAGVPFVGDNESERPPKECHLKSTSGQENVCTGKATFSLPENLVTRKMKKAVYLNMRIHDVHGIVCEHAFPIFLLEAKKADPRGLRP